ncbi:MAG TPA: AAA family ATPase, partial [Paracoccaceae bacterium]|nr:AAA family ATPase [Paracoccaceae bacterium]
APGDRPLLVSAGVATGWMVVGDTHQGQPARETLAIGGTVNLAARLQAEAGPGRVAVSEEVCRRLDPALFALRPLGARPLKGFANPVDVWIVAPAEEEAAPFEFVGRADTLGILEREWASAKAGAARVVDIVAPGGYGKTTLARRFLSLAIEEHELFELQGLSHRRQQSFACFRPFVLELAGINPSAPLDEQLGTLRAWAPSGTEAGLALLTGLDETPMAASLRQERVAQALDGVFDALVGARPAVLFIEDAHWLDPDSAALLGRLPTRLAGRPLLILGTRRPEGPPIAAPEAVRIELDELGDEEAHAMIGALDPAGRLPSPARAMIVARASGVPLYLEHIARAVLERPEAGADLGIPVTMIEALLERFDHVGDAQPLVEAAAVLGAEVRVDVLAHMLARSRTEVSAQLARLVARELFAPGGEGTVVFDHSLIRDAVLGTLLSSQRAILHRRALAAYAEAAPDRLEADPALAAYHLLGAGRKAEAIPTLIEAARRATMRGEIAESVGLLRRAEAALGDVRDRHLHDDLAMKTQFALGLALVQHRGFADPGVVEAYNRALELCLANAGGGETEFQIAWGIWAHLVVVGEVDKALQMAARMDEIAGADASLEVLAASARSVTEWNMGRFAAQEAAVARVRALYDLGAHRLHAVTYSMDSLELALLFQIHGRYIAGDLPGWQAAMEAARAHEARLDLPFLAPYIRIYGNAPHCYSLSQIAYRTEIEAATSLAAELGQPFWILAGALWLAAERGRREGWVAALPDLEAAVGRCHATGLRLGASYHEALLAFGYADAGRISEAEAMIGRAASALAEGRDAMYAAEVRRIGAEILILARPGAVAEAEAALAGAAALAAAQDARAWSAHIAASQARLRARSEGREAAERWLAAELGRLTRPGSEQHPAFRAAAQAFERPI